MFTKILMPALMAVSFTFVNPCSKPKNFGPGKDDRVFEVRAVHPEFISLPESHAVDGTFDVVEKSQVTAHVDGTVEQIFVNEGDNVTKDDPLVGLSNQTVLEQIDIKRSKIKEFQSRLELIESKIEDNRGEDLPVDADDAAFLDEEPLEEPVQKDFGSAGDVKSSQKTQKSLASLLRSAIERYTKEADALDRKLLNMTITSPVNGVVVKKYVTEGNVVKEQQALLEIATTDPLSITFFIPESVANFVDKNSKVMVTPKDAVDLKTTGTVYFVSPQIDSETQTFEVRARVSNKESRIKGGQKADVYLATRKMARIMVLPEICVFEKDGKKFVFAVIKERAKLFEVKTEPHETQGMLKIFGADLRIDDFILTERPEGIEDRSFVRLILE